MKLTLTSKRHGSRRGHHGACRALSRDLHLSIDLQPASMRDDATSRASLDGPPSVDPALSLTARITGMLGRRAMRGGVRLLDIIIAPPARRDVDGPIRCSRASGRRLEGGLDGSSSRGTAAYATAGRPAMAPSRAGLKMPGQCLPDQIRLQDLPTAGGLVRSGDRKTAEPGAERQPVREGASPPTRLRSRHPAPVISSRPAPARSKAFWSGAGRHGSMSGVMQAARPLETAAFVPP
jgi:hypothetical protein